MPGDRFPFAIGIGCEVEFVGRLQFARDFAHGRLFCLVEDVDGLKAFLDARDDLLFLFVGRYLTGFAGQIPNMANARLNDVVLAEVFLDSLGFGW